MKLKDLELGIVSYCEQRIEPQNNSTHDRWIFFAGIGLLGSKLEAAIQTLAPSAAGFGLIDGDGNIDLDLLERVCIDAFEKQPKVSIWNLTFTREDFADLMRHLRG